MAGIGLKSIGRLAERAKIGRDRLYDWSKGEEVRFSVEELRRLAGVLEISVPELIGEGAA